MPVSKENQIIEMLEAINHKLNIVQKQVEFLAKQESERSQIPNDANNPSLYNPIFSQTMGELYNVMLRINRQKDNPTSYPEYLENFDNYISESKEF